MVKTINDNYHKINKTIKLNELDNTIITLQDMMEGRFIQFVQMFIGTADGLFKDLEKAIHEKSLKGVFAAAHSLKSSMGQIGAAKNFLIMKIIEDKIDEGDWQCIEDYVKEAQENYIKVRNELKILAS